MAKGGSFLADFDDRGNARSSLPLGRFPGRVWMIMLWLAFSTVKILSPLATGIVDTQAEYSRWVIVVFSVASFIALWVMAARTPQWFLKIQVVVGILGLCVMSYTAPSVLVAATLAWGFMALACYTACWFSWRFTIAEVAFTSISYLVTLILMEQLGELLPLWIVVSLSTLAFGVVLSLIMRRMQMLIMVDPLTGLINRKGLEVVLEAQASAGQVTTPRSLVVIDLDAFKTINDQRGHQAGDAILRDFSDGLRNMMRPDDIAVRSGGDEFLLILPRTDIAGAEGLMRRLKFRIPIAHSFGVAEWNIGSAFDSAVAEADRLMYTQKSRRREQLM
ncbi:MAG: GGDEF domain-containing protein [Actinomycetota bacterium]|nr:GGDEF domain-containing protein [Actinomycetota bacterium]